MSSTARYLPGTLETDHKKINQVIQNIGNDTDTNTTNISTNTTNIATNTAKLNQLVFVTDYGAKGDGVTDDAPAFRAAILAAPYGGTVYIPPGKYLLNSVDPSATHVIDFSNIPNKALTLQGSGWDLKFGGVYTNPKGSILLMGSSIGTTIDYIYASPTDRWTGLKFKDFAMVAAAGVFNTAHGRHAIHIDGTNFPTTGYMEFFEMKNVFIDNTANGYSLTVQGNVSSTNSMIDSEIEDCVFMNTRFDYVADNITVERCVFGANAFETAGGPNKGIYVNQINGATSFRIIGCNFVNQNGMIHIDSALSPIIRDCEFEQNPGANSLGSMVDIAGGVSTVVGPVITGCSITNNSTTGTIYPIATSAVQGGLINGNTMRVPTGGTHINLGASTQFITEDANTYFVNGVLSQAGTIIDSGTKNILRTTGWTAYTPTITSDTGTFTTVSATGRYKLLSAKTLAIEIDITITTVGTAAGGVHATLPSGFTAAARNFSIHGNEFAITGKVLRGAVLSGATSVTGIVNYDNTTAIGAGAELVLTGQIEIA